MTLEKEYVLFENDRVPLNLMHLSMCKGGTYRGMHVHTVIEVVNVTDGVLDCHVNSEVVRVFPGQTIFVNGNTAHCLVSDDARLRYLHMDAEGLTDETSGIHAFVQRSKAEPYMVVANAEIGQLFDKIDAKREDHSAAGRWYMKACFCELTAFMCAESFIASAAVSSEQMSRIESIVRYIDDNFRQQLTLEDICAAVLYNKYTVCHLFKAVTGATVFEYINFLRVRAAAQRLKQTGISVLEIAAQSGFASASYFNRVFKTVMGCSPSAYRKLLAE